MAAPRSSSACRPRSERTLEGYPHSEAVRRPAPATSSSPLAHPVTKLIICDEPTHRARRDRPEAGHQASERPSGPARLRHDLRVTTWPSSPRSAPRSPSCTPARSSGGPPVELLTNPIAQVHARPARLRPLHRGRRQDGTRLHQVPGSVPSPERTSRRAVASPRSSHPRSAWTCIRHQVGARQVPSFSELPDDLKASGSRRTSSSVKTATATSELNEQRIRRSPSSSSLTSPPFQNAPSLLHPNLVRAVNHVTIKLMPETIGIVGRSPAAASRPRPTSCAACRGPTSVRSTSGQDVTKPRTADRKRMGRVVSVCVPGPRNRAQRA